MNFRLLNLRGFFCARGAGGCFRLPVLPSAHFTSASLRPTRQRYNEHCYPIDLPTALRLANAQNLTFR